VLIDGRKYWREKDGWYVNFVGDVLPMRYEWRMWGCRYWQRGYFGGGDPYYRVGEVTGRTKRLIKQQDGTYTLIENPKDKNVANTFKKFNDGFYDVLLINESGSTGASAHSSIRYADQRPRVMIVHQVELDVNTEVQKRGRINRTGMVNYPTYVYIVSKIPSEIRRLLMLAKKLRKLDANTTGNQKQSEKLSEIKDNKGNAIQDIMNKYGDEVLNVFLEDPAHSQYTIYQKSDEAKGRGVLSGELEIESFVREIELARADEQKYFFDTINQLYIQKVEEKKQEGINDLETEILDLRASIKNRSILIQGENTSPFNSSVYAEDIFGFVQDNPLSKDEVDAFQLKLSSGRDPVEFYEEIKEDFKIVQEKTLEQIIKDIEVPDYKSAATEEEKDKIKQAYDNKIKKVTESFNKDKKKISDYLNFFKPNMPVAIPTIEEDCYETDESGNPKKVIEFNNGKFIGVKITSAAKHKYSPMNIEFVFCQLNGKPKVSYKPTTKGSFVLDAIMEKTKYIENFRLVSINNWVVDKNTRRLHRIITGNLIQGYSVAEDLITKYPESYGKSLEFLKFTTTYEGSIRYGIRMKMTPFKEIDVKASKTVYNINQQQFMDLLLSPDSLFVAVNSAQTVMFDCYNRQIYIRIFGGTTRKSKGEAFWVMSVHPPRPITSVVIFCRFLGQVS
jgi:ribosomal protein S6